ncbi:MAG: hypothetical protein ACLU0X_02355 [Lachnospiraceae bacterium]|jgi:hypothetical protein
MHLLEEIKRIQKHHPEKITIFVDMDGVVADYRFGEGENIKSNKRGVYINKRPIYTTINNLREINDEIDCRMCILSSCLYKEQAEEKKQWLNRYMSFIKNENMLFILPKDFESRKKLKIEKIKELIDLKECELAIIIDDTHEILFLAISELKEKVIPFHVISLID